MIRDSVAAIVVLALLGPVSAQVGEPKSARVDGHGDPLPRGAITRLGSARLCNQGQLAGLAFSPDGKWLASEDGAGTVRLWDAATGRLVRAMDAPVKGWGPLAFAPNGKLLASTAGGKTVCIWAPDNGMLVRRLQGHGDIRSIVFSPNSEFLATGSGDGSIVLWDAATGKPLHTLKGHRDSPNGLAFAPDNKTLASTGHDGSTRLWDVASGKALAVIAPSPFATSSVAFSNDGKTLIVTSGTNSSGQIRFFDVETHQQLRQFQAEKRGVLCMALSKDGKTMVTGGYDQCVRFFDVATAAELGQIPNQSGSVNQVVLSPDGATVAWSAHHGSRIHLAKVVQLPNKTLAFKEHLPRAGHESGIGYIAYSPDGKRFLSTSNDNYAILWDEASGKELHRFCKGYRGAWSHDSKQIALTDVNDGYKKMIYIFDADTGKETQAISAPAQVYSMAFSTDRRTLTIAGSDGAIHLIELDTSKIRTSIRGTGEHLWRAIVAPDGLTVAAASQTDIRLFDAISTKEIARVPLKISSGPVAFSPDGRLLACGMYSEGTVLWDLTQGKEARRIPGRALGLAFTPDGQTLATACLDHTVRLFDVATGKEQHRFVGHAGWAMSVAVSPDGRSLLSGSIDTTILMWPIDPYVKGKPIRHAGLPAQELKARLAGLPAGNPEQWWADLGRPDAAKAYLGLWGLVSQPRATLEMLKLWNDALSAAPINRLIDDLDDIEFARREAANKKLEMLGRFAEPALREALAGKLSLEARRRAERILALREAGLANGLDEGLRLLRTVEVLERIGNPEARALLARLAKQTAVREPAQRAREALERLAKNSRERE